MISSWRPAFIFAQAQLGLIGTHGPGCRLIRVAHRTSLAPSGLHRFALMQHHDIVKSQIALVTPRR
ncbi:MAG: hypothetical protein ACRELT_18530, partial [Longimicrobiales bacterium]